MTFRLSAVCAFLIVAVMAVAPVSASAGSSPVVLTVIGNIEKSNRGARNDFSDAYLKFREKSFDKAYEFSLDDLSRLPQIKVSADSKSWPKQVTLTGPRLVDVLNAAGVSAKPVALTGLDGYEIELTTEQLAGREWILALSADGRPLAVGGHGPLWLVHDTNGEKVGEDVEANWVWAVFAITVQ